MEWYEFQMILSEKPERCDKCKKIFKYSPSQPGYIYSNSAVQYCPKCMTEINDKYYKKEIKSKKLKIWEL